jgi:2-methylisocitrate lyase-like PEP mutase family enzyme
VTPAGSRWSGLQEGTRTAALPEMQTRADLYEVLDYAAHERQADLLAAAGTA